MKKKTKIILISAIVLFVLAFVLSIVLIYNKKQRDKTVKIAFYDVSKEISDTIKNQLTGSDNIKIQFYNLNEKTFNSESINKKYDILFIKDGLVADELSKKARPVSDKIMELMPSSYRSSKIKVPVVLDHYEFAYNKNSARNAGKELPTSFTDFINYLEVMKDYNFSPFFCVGGDDDILLALLSVVAESLVGKEGYEKFGKLFLENETLEEIIDKSIGNAGIDDVSLRYILDILKTWPEKGYTHPNWYKANKNDLDFFIEQNQVSVVFMSLSQHRTIPFRYIKEFLEERSPYYSNAINHSLICPKVVVMQFGNNGNTKKMISQIVSMDAQAAISEKSLLAPVNSHAQAHDTQSDDVRFWAASCLGGPVPPVGDLAFQKKDEAKKAICEEIRNYLAKK